MKKLALLLTLLITLSSCGSSKSRNITTKKTTKTSKRVVSSKKKRTSTSKKNSTRTVSSNTISSIIKNAKKYNGVRYKMGGTTKSGMDCSGLLYTSFKEENIALPRTSSAMSTTGEWIDIKNVEKGDLLFFATNKKKGRRINHVGLVTESRVGYVKFIHSSSSKGVMESVLSEKYWYFAFVQARRVL